MSLTSFKDYFKSKVAADSLELVEEVDFVLEYDQSSSQVTATTNTSSLGNFYYDMRLGDTKNSLQTRFNLLPQTQLINLGLVKYDGGVFKPNKKLKGVFNFKDNKAVITGFTEESFNNPKCTSRLINMVNTIKTYDVHYIDSDDVVTDTWSLTFKKLGS